MNDEIKAIESQITDLKVKLAEAQARATPEAVADFELVTGIGAQRLSSFLGDADDLLVVHNMGKSCPYCTLWADGFSGYLRHIGERCGFLVVSPDDPETQQKLAGARGWTFNMAQDASREFTSAMGFWNERDGWWPGVSAFHRGSDGSIVRTGCSHFGPGDDYCMVWPLFNLLDGGANGWEPH